MVENIPNGLHTITLCPDDKHQYINSPVRMQQVTHDVRDLLYKTIGSKYVYELYPEVSYPTNTQEGRMARIHWHGIIQLNGMHKPEFFIEKLHRLNRWNRIEIDTINDLNKWREYISKNKDDMVSYCKENKVPYMLHHKMLYKPHAPDGVKN